MRVSSVVVVIVDTETPRCYDEIKRVRGHAYKVWLVGLGKVDIIDIQRAREC